jgi:hypothetical protein
MKATAAPQRRLRPDLLHLQFDRRRILADPDDQRRIALHMRGIAIREDSRNEHQDNWLSDYEAELYKAGNIELHKGTGYLDCFTHAGGKQARSPELKRNLIAVLISHSTNLGLTRMADASGISYDVLAWTSEWYVREETPARGEPGDH